MSERFNPFSLEGKTILITGASSGIGRATAIACSKMGARVVITGRNEERLSETFSQLIPSEENQMIVCDMIKSEQLNHLVDSVLSINGLVLSAGINSTLPLKFFTKDKIYQIFEVNLFSQVELFRLLHKKKLLKDSASVVAISSIGGNYVYTPGSTVYGASKAALCSWVKTAAKELAPKIRFNCVCPGHINTPMNNYGYISEEEYAKYRDSIPMHRFGEPEEVAYGVIYLLSEASSLITGSELIIDGGASL